MFFVQTKVIDSNCPTITDGGYLIKVSPEIEANYLKVRLLNYRKNNILSMFQKLDGLFIPSSETEKRENRSKVTRILWDKYISIKYEISKLEAYNFRAYKESLPNLTGELYNHFQA